jgi:hypothetical protein
MSVIKGHKPQAGNPHKLTFWQHVFPAKSLERFAGPDGKVAVKHCQADKEFKLAPDNELFCAQRRWDQRAEAGYMKDIENQFQSLGDEIITGLRTIDDEQSRIVTRFFALWRLRFHHKHAPLPDHFIKGVVEEHLSEDQEELLESKWVGYFSADQMMPGRIVAGIQIQTNIQAIDAHLRGNRWGVVTADKGEFIVPDTFGVMTVVPVTPTICLVCAREDMEISNAEVSKINRLAMRYRQDYCVARDFTQCPL